MSVRSPFPRLDDGAGPAQARSPGELADMRDLIVTRAARRGAHARARSALRVPLRVAAAVALCLASVGTGLAAVRVFPPLRQWLAPAPPSADAPQEPAADAPHRRARRARPHTSDTTAVELDPAAEPADLAEQDPAAEPQPDAVTRRSPGEGARPHAAPRAPEDLLAHANQLRAARRWRAAEQLYLRVLDDSDSASARSAAALAAADLRLSQLGEPRGALALFERTLRLQPSGPLCEQARHGIAQSYRALDEPEREARALQAFITAHPKSAMRPRAEARLRALGGLNNAERAAP